MTHCCSSSQTRHTGSHYCPINGRPYKEVSLATVLHHIRHAWANELTASAYYYCDAPDCEVVYFDSNDSIISKNDLRTRVGVKETADDAPVCYCFGVNRKQAAEIPASRAFVIEQTRRRVCSCATSNPSGRCCLKDFPDT